MVVGDGIDMIDRDGKYLWQCPECKTWIQLEYPSAMRLCEKAGACQGCRARATFGRTGMMGMFVDFWERTSYPQSSSWATDLPVA